MKNFLFNNILVLMNIYNNVKTILFLVSQMYHKTILYNKTGEQGRSLINQSCIIRMELALVDFKFKSLQLYRKSPYI